MVKVEESKNKKLAIEFDDNLSEFDKEMQRIKTAGYFNNDKENIKRNDYMTLEDFNWKSASWKLKLPTTLEPPHWCDTQYLTIEKSPANGKYSAEVYVNRRPKRITNMTTLGELASFLFKEELLDSIKPFDVNSLNQQIKLVINERTQRAKLKRDRNMDDFCHRVDEYMLNLDEATLVDWETNRPKCTAYQMLEELKLIHLLSDKAVAAKASWFCKEYAGLGDQIESERVGDSRYPSNFYPYYVLRSIVEQLVSEFEYSYD